MVDIKPYHMDLFGPHQTQNIADMVIPSNLDMIIVLQGRKIRHRTSKTQNLAERLYQET